MTGLAGGDQRVLGRLADGPPLQHGETGLAAAGHEDQLWQTFSDAEVETCYQTETAHECLYPSLVVELSSSGDHTRRLLGSD